jgi:hypothetical protein
MSNKHDRTTQRTKNSESTSPASRKSSRDNLCQFPFSDGRTCRMPRWTKHRTLCVFHARAEQQLLAVEQVGRQLVSLSGEFKTASDINHALGKLFSLVARNRIARRDAVALAYIGQLLLQSLPQVRTEIKTALGYRAWDATVQDALCDAEPESDEAQDSDDSDSSADDSGDESSDEGDDASDHASAGWPSGASA